MHVGVHGKARNGQNAGGRFHIGSLQPHPCGEAQPARDAAIARLLAIMIDQTLPPDAPVVGVGQPGDDDRVLFRDRTLVIIAIQRPSLNLLLRAGTGMQHAVKRMMIVVVTRADPAQRFLKLFIS